MYSKASSPKIAEWDLRRTLRIWIQELKLSVETHIYNTLIPEKSCRPRSLAKRLKYISEPV